MRRPRRSPRAARGTDGAGAEPTRADPNVYTLDEARDSDPNRVTISVVIDPHKLLAERSAALHGDVIDALVALVIELVEEERDDAEGDDHR